MRSLLDGLRKSLQHHGSRNAFCIQDVYYSYQALYEQVLSIASALQPHKGKHSGRIGVVTTNTLETYASILACWFTGNAYVPLNPNFPVERNRFSIHQAEIGIILSSDAAVEATYAGISNLSLICTTELTKTGEPVLEKFLEDESLLYILFTSGSTGTPKGVPINYGNLKAFVDSYDALGMPVKDNDRFLQMFDLTFDVSVASFVLPLLHGACIYTVSPEGIKYMNVYKLLRDKEINVAFIVPSIINYLKPYFSQIKLPHLRYCVLTAEASLLENVQQWALCLPNGTVVNLYGPTEATIWCTGYFFNAQSPKTYNSMLAIGQPFKNVEAFILNEEGRELATGTKGELCIASTQLTIGYLNDNEKTKKAFIEWEGKRLYKTGDLCYKDDEGDIVYCGRIDHQVKIQGFRIELNEIEAVVKGFTSVNNVAVVYKNKLGSDQICLFVEKYAGEVSHLKKQLEEKLPYYMIPSQIRIIDELPHNASSKVDRVLLSKNAGEHD